MIDKTKIIKRLSELGITDTEIITYGITDSTNTRAREYAKKYGKDGKGTAVFIAEGQTNGRGRRGRSFYSECGKGLYMTLLLHPMERGADAAAITACTAVRLRRAILALTGTDTKIKWVNDIYAKEPTGERYKKLAGILAEAEMNSLGVTENLYLGIGINLCRASLPEEISDIAVSLEEVSGERVGAEELAAELIAEILTEEKREILLAEYRAASLTVGRKITVKPLFGEHYTASALDITDDFSLVIEKESGEREILLSGEVSTEV